jgi:hypothetical protein
MPPPASAYRPRAKAAGSQSRRPVRAVMEVTITGTAVRIEPGAVGAGDGYGLS